MNNNLLASGSALHRAGSYAEARTHFQEVLKSDPDSSIALYLLALSFCAEGKYEEGLASLNRSISANPTFADAHFYLGVCLGTLKQYDKAVDSYQTAITLAPTDAESHNNLGVVFLELARLDDAVAAFEAALRIKPTYAQAHSNLGIALTRLGDYEMAKSWFESSLRLNSKSAETYTNLGVALSAMNKHDLAIAAHRTALSIDGRNADALINLGAALTRQGNDSEAETAYRLALAICPNDAELHHGLGVLYSSNGNWLEAAKCFRAALTIAPRHAHAPSLLVRAEQQMCEWSNYSEHVRMLRDMNAHDQSIVSPFVLLSVPSSLEEQLTCARRYASVKTNASKAARTPDMARPAKRINLAYASSDFHSHATAYLIAELFELHDRSQFQVIGISWGPDDGSALRARLVNAFDKFIDVRDQSDSEVANLIRRLKVDILVDLKGHTEMSRPGIFAHRAAPVQISFLGYPGTMGANFMDYIIADKYVAPFDHQAFYSENIVHLPDSYQVNDASRIPSISQYSRADCGLPLTGFVYCCFNNNYKISPEVFSIWMRILRSVDQSVLWLLGDNSFAIHNLRAAAIAQQVGPERLVFAHRTSMPDHLARQQHADLFLDTLPVNAHTTCSDALCAGVPVLTCLGDTFAGRVAASLLNTIGLPEMVTNSLVDYENLAIRLAQNPASITAIRSKLQQNLTISPLFNSARFTKNLESAFLKMRQLHVQGQPPSSFSV